MQIGHLSQLLQLVALNSPVQSIIFAKKAQRIFAAGDKELHIMGNIARGHNSKSHILQTLLM